MKSKLFQIGKGVSFACLGVAIAGGFRAVIGEAFIWPEGGIIVAAAVWLTLHIVTKPVETKVIVEPQELTEGQRLRQRLFVEDEAQDIAEYAVMLAVILVIVVGTIKLIGSNANNVFSHVADELSPQATQQ